MTGKIEYTTPNITKRKPVVSPTNAIVKDYAEILVNQMLANTESNGVLSARTKLQFYDHKLKDLGFLATIKVGIEKIE